MRILHIGNIANNAYNNAKFLRRKGVEADVLVYDYSHVMSQPEWEDAAFDGEVDEYYPDWARVNLNGFRREAWFHQLDLQVLHRNPFEGRRKYFYGQFFLESKAMQCKRVLDRAAQYLRWRFEYQRLVRHRRDPLRYPDVTQACAVVQYLRPYMAGYDVIQAYGLYEPKFAMLSAPDCPLVAFEHGTMRDFPFEDSAHGRWISLAYKKARKVVITNADSILSARKMGLDNVVFIPHPVDETVCRRQATVHRFLRAVLKMNAGAITCEGNIPGEKSTAYVQSSCFAVSRSTIRLVTSGSTKGESSLTRTTALAHRH